MPVYDSSKILTESDTGTSSNILQLTETNMGTRTNIKFLPDTSTSTFSDTTTSTNKNTSTTTKSIQILTSNYIWANKTSMKPPHISISQNFKFYLMFHKK